MLDRLWAGWRGAYVATAGEVPTDGPSCVFCRILASGVPDEETFVLWRGARAFAILNAYPYTSGHLMVMPLRHAADLDELDDDEAAELFDGVRQATRAVKAAYGCEGMNVGMNIGRAGGAGVPGHLHAHVLPRWVGDTNFMTAVAETRVLPELLTTAYAKLTEAWPA